MKKLLNHIKRWWRWRKYNTNAWWYKFLVLLGICHSPTLIYFDDIKDVYNKLREKYGWPNVELQLDDNSVEVENKITIEEVTDDESSSAV